MKWKMEPTGDLSGFLDQGAEFKGEMNFKDTLRIDGKFEGSIRSGKTLVIGETADVNAEIEVDSIFVAGRLRGSVRASERVELTPSAKVESTLDTAVLVVQEGAVFEGQCAMGHRKQGPREVASSDHVKKIISSN